MTKVNINCKIKVKLTDEGVARFNKYFDELLRNYNAIRSEDLKRDAEGYTSFQMWEFFHIFGDRMFMGADAVIEGNEIIIAETL